MFHFDTVTEDYLRTLRDLKYSDATIRSRRFSLKKLSVFMNERRIDRIQDVGVEHVEAYRDWMRECGLKENTLENHLYSLRRFFDHLEKRSLVFENPARLVQLCNPRKPLPKVIGVEKVMRLLNAPDCDTPGGLRDRAMLEVLYSTGMRRSELIRLTVDDVDRRSNTVRVHGKGDKERTLPLGKHAAEYVDLYLKEARPEFVRFAEHATERLWLNRYKRAYSDQMVCKMVKKYAAEAGLPTFVTAHTLRRCCATHMLNGGAHPAAVSELLGHSRLATLSRYLRISIVELKKTHSDSRLGG